MTSVHSSLGVSGAHRLCIESLQPLASEAPGSALGLAQAPGRPTPRPASEPKGCWPAAGHAGLLAAHSAQPALDASGPARPEGQRENDVHLGNVQIRYDQT